MIRTLFFFLLLVFTFGAGFYLGAAGSKEVKESYSTLKEEMTVKTRGLESEVSSMRARLNLIEARDFLGLARQDIRNRNFGEAEFKIKKAEERVAKAVSLSSETQKEKLAPFQAKIGEIREGLQKQSARIGTEIEAVEKDLEKITG